MRLFFRNFRVATNNENPLSSSILNPCVSPVINNGNEKFFSEGNIKADLLLNGSIFSPKIRGYISFSGLKIPDYDLSISNAAFIFRENTIDIDFKDLQMDDSVMDIKANADYPSELPVLIRNISITSDFTNVDNIAKTFIANKDLVNNNSDTKLPYFVIEKGTLDSKELILHDLITSNVHANISFTPDWLLSVSNINMRAAGGTGTGNLYYNTKSSELSLNLNAKNIQANALATTFFRLPNEVYGTLNGESQFYTKGRNIEEIISNLNGYANFKVTDGHLLRLGSLEYFLRAANVVQSGIGGLNFNNIIDLLAPQKTGYFNHLEGRVDIKDGILRSQGITSSGQNLALLISGSFDMLTDNSNIKILGNVSKKVTGLLGPLGSVSINQFIGYIPGFGFLPNEPDEKGLIDYIPGLKKVPLLGLEGKQKYRQFGVEINGNLYEPKSVKSFRWID